MDWRSLFIMLSGFAVCASLAIFFLVPEKPAVAQATTLRAQFAVIAGIFKNRGFWSIAFARPHISSTGVRPRRLSPLARE